MAGSQCVHGHRVVEELVGLLPEPRQVLERLIADDPEEADDRVAHEEVAARLVGPDRDRGICGNDPQGSATAPRRDSADPRGGPDPRGGSDASAAAVLEKDPCRHHAHRHQAEPGRQFEVHAQRHQADDDDDGHVGHQEAGAEAERPRPTRRYLERAQDPVANDKRRSVEHSEQDEFVEAQARSGERVELRRVPRVAGWSGPDLARREGLGGVVVDGLPVRQVQVRILQDSEEGSDGEEDECGRKESVPGDGSDDGSDGGFGHVA